MRIAYLFPAVAALTLIAGSATALLPNHPVETAQDSAPVAACVAPAAVLPIDQSNIGDSNGLKAAEDMHLTDANEVLAFAKIVQALGAPDSVLTADEVLVIKFTDASGADAGKKHVVFFTKGCKTDAGFVGTQMLTSMLRGA